MMIRECPICGPVRVIGEVLMSGLGYVDPRTNEVIEEPDYLDFDESDTYDLVCTKCGCSGL